MKKLLMGILLLSTSSVFASAYTLSCKQDIAMFMLGKGIAGKINNVPLVEGKMTRIKGETHDLNIEVTKKELEISLTEKETEDGALVITSVGFKLEKGNTVRFYFNDGNTSVFFNECKIK
jgi:hypothetical protein